MSKYNRYIIFSIILAITSLFVFEITKSEQMSDNYIGPYLSCARNLTIGGDFLININEVKSFQNMDINQQLDYKFKETDNLVYYNHNPIGYAYFIKIATTLFFFMGNEAALILFHFLIHFTLCLFVIKNIKNRKLEILFIIFYACNPFILRYIVFNFYYIYQEAPSFFLLYLLYKKDLTYLGVILAAILMALVFLTRPTVILLLLIIGFYILHNYNWEKLVLYITVFFMVFFIINKPTQKNPWFTAYVGLAAYNNKYVSQLSDKAAYNLYKAETGKTVNASVGGNYYEDSTIRVFKKLLKNKYLSIVKSDPTYILQNALLNFFSSFSVGYLTFLNSTGKFIIALTGLLFFVFLLLKKQYKWIIIIAMASATFTPYYPPIPAYMFGSYLLIVFGLFETIQFTRFKNFFNR